MNQQVRRPVATSTIDKLRAQWSQYNSPQLQTKSLVKRHRQKEKKPQKQQQTKRDFHYECPRCNEPIFYNQYWFDDFQNRYIPLSVYTHRPHKCYQKEAERKEGLMNGTFVVPPSARQ